jgi:hypothetical protein
MPPLISRDGARRLGELTDRDEILALVEPAQTPSVSALPFGH